MADVTDILKAELGVKSDKHHHQPHHHDKIIVPTSEAKDNVTYELQSQLGHGKEVDQEIQKEEATSSVNSSSSKPTEQDEQQSKA